MVKQIINSAFTLSSFTYKKFIYQKSCEKSSVISLKYALKKKSALILFDEVDSTFPWFQNSGGNVSIIIISKNKR